MTFAPSASTIRWLSFRNQTEETIPPFAALRPTGVITVEGQAVLTVAKPTSSGGRLHFFNSPFPVTPGGFGSCTGDFPCYAAHDVGDLPTSGEEWGTAADSWVLTKGNTGFRIVGGAHDGRVQVTASYPSSQLVHFYLNADLARGDSQFAQVLEWNGTLWQPGPNTIEVFDSSSIGPASATQLGVCHLSDESQRYEIITLRQRTGDGIRWAKATAKWVNEPDNDSYVQCHQALDKEGTLDLDDEEQPQTVTVYLPRPGSAVDPNVRTDDVIGYQIDDNGDAIAVTGYLDDAIGTVKMWAKPEEEVPGGWRIYANSPGRFPVGCTSSDEDIAATEPGTTGGEKKHTHDAWQTEYAVVQIAPHTGIETQPVEITVLPHVGYYTEDAYVQVLPAAATTAYLSGMTEEAGAQVNGSGVVPVDGTGTVNTSAVSLHTDNAGGSGTVTGTTGTANAIISVVGVTAHDHQVAGGSSSVQQWTSGPAVGVMLAGPHTTSSDGAHGHDLNQTPHSHSFSGSATLSTHSHNIAAHDHTVSITEIAAALTVSGSAIAEVLSVAPHAHAISELTVEIPYHTHDTAPHFHALPFMEHSVWPNPHAHGIDSLLHDADPHFHVIPETPEAKHIPPWFGIHFIERYE